jgi:hypothetical protein
MTTLREDCGVREGDGTRKENDSREEGGDKTRRFCGLACGKQAWGAAVLRPYTEKRKPGEKPHPVNG